VGQGDGTKRFLTEYQAKTLAEKSAAGPVRDNASQCLVFSYQDGNVTYQVWYADAITLRYWLALAKKQGYSSISLWRLGGNVQLNRVFD